MGTVEIGMKDRWCLLFHQGAAVGSAHPVSCRVSW